MGKIKRQPDVILTEKEKHRNRNIFYSIGVKDIKHKYKGSEYAKNVMKKRSETLKKIMKLI